MTHTPFRDAAKRAYARVGHDYIMMQVGCDRARSHGWWRNVIDYGPWGEPGTGRVGPPTPEAFEGIAKLFETTVEHVREMIAADWYDVHPEAEVSAHALRLSPVLDQLGEDDLALLESIARRLAKR